jgi:hypothetical protein
MPTLNWLTREADLQAAAKTVRRLRGLTQIKKTNLRSSAKSADKCYKRNPLNAHP